MSRVGTLVLTLLPALAIVAGIGLGIGLLPGLRQEFLVVWDLLLDGDVEPLRIWLRSFGAWAPLISVLLQVATSVFPPGPSFLLALANPLVFGPVAGGLLTLGSAVFAAGICFGLARWLGRPWVSRVVSPDKLARMDAFMARNGVFAVFLGRLIPFINPDLVSYAAGVTGIRWGPFLLAMALGTLPSTLFYTAIAITALEATGWVIVGVVAVSVIPLLLLVLLRPAFFRRGWLTPRFREPRARGLGGGHGGGEGGGGAQPPDRTDTRRADADRTDTGTETEADRGTPDREPG
jgi:uncharacterized membrane protein YdjX (TVP38/TMEM64 family)